MILEDLEPTAAEGNQKIPGRPNDQTSYRAELAGILALITSINFICTLEKINTGQVTIACDNDSALSTALDYQRVTTKSKSRDLLQAIYYQ